MDVVVDVRPVLDRGGEPLPRILEAVRSLPEGSRLVVLAPFEPEPLYGVLARQGFEHEAEDRGDEGFRVVFFRPG